MGRKKSKFYICVIVSFQFLLLEMEDVSNISGKNIQYLLP